MPSTPHSRIATASAAMSSLFTGHALAQEVAPAGLAGAATPVVVAAPVAPAPVVSPTVEASTLRVGALLQTWYTANNAVGASHGFSIRRAELSASGKGANGKAAWQLMIDPARVLEAQAKTYTLAGADPAAPASLSLVSPVSPIAVLQDVWVSFVSECADVRVGQFKIPVGFEGSRTSSADLIFAERALATRRFSDRRDIGMQVHKTFKQFGYVVGVFNGAGQNTPDNDSARDGALRLEAYPVPALTVAAVAYRTLNRRDSATVRDRYEVDLRWAAGGVLVLAEVFKASDVAVAKGKTADSMGFHATASYVVDGHWEPALRVSMVQPDTAASKQTWQYEGGVNYRLDGSKALARISYAQLHTDGSDATQQLTFAGQVAF